MEGQPAVATEEKDTSMGAGQTLLIIVGIVATALCPRRIQINGLYSKAGNTVAEFYYQACGWMCFGLSCFTRPLLWTLAASFVPMTLQG